MLQNYVPNPGSDEAIRMGCLCAVDDNRHGLGATIDKHGNAIFWFSYECPVHGWYKDLNKREKENIK